MIEKFQNLVNLVSQLVGRTRIPLRLESFLMLWLKEMDLALTNVSIK